MKHYGDIEEQQTRKHNHLLRVRGRGELENLRERWGRDPAL